MTPREPAARAWRDGRVAPGGNRPGPPAASHPDVDKLLSTEPTAGRPVLSVYLSLPRTPAGTRSLPAHMAELTAAATSGRDGRRVAAAGMALVRRVLEVHGRDWLGRTVAVFTDGAGLAEVTRLPCAVPERVVLAARPHVRPLLAASQRGPAYQTLVADERHAWLFQVDGDRMDILTQPAPGSAYGGWLGLGSRRARERVSQFPHHAHHEMASLLEHTRPTGGLVVAAGGPEGVLPRLLADLPPGVRSQVAGFVAAEPATTTPERVRELAGPVIADSISRRERELAARCVPGLADQLTVTGLSACLAAVNAGGVRLLLLPDSGLVPGFTCRHCGELARVPSVCPHRAQDSAGVPDLLEEMAVQTLRAGGDAATVGGLPATVGALLRFPRAELAVTRIAIPAPRSVASGGPAGLVPAAG